MSTVALSYLLPLQHLGEDSKSISLTSVYPRKDLDQEMASITLTQLQLVPSGVVIVRKKVRGEQGGLPSSVLYVMIESLLIYPASLS